MRNCTLIKEVLYFKHNVLLMTNTLDHYNIVMNNMTWPFVEPFYDSNLKIIIGLLTTDD